MGAHSDQAWPDHRSGVLRRTCVLPPASAEAPGRAAPPAPPAELRGDRLTLVAAYTSDTPNVEETLDRAWTWFHLADGPTLVHSPIAATYRSRGNRRLGIGDVIEVAGRPYAVTRFGFSPLLRLTNLTSPGTTAVEVDPAELAPLLDFYEVDAGEWVAFVPCPR